ncbi:sensor histidine kinase [Antribacter gilvus]|uniref:sensor histidine kinase n=1 Tax=Antribacter gilvus TaxID=2304675 RepID=UPI001F0C6992|nr:histidine kinase [Antribacter gilvus]
MDRPTALSTRPRLTERALEWFGVDVDWERVPPAGAYRNDFYLAGILTALAVFGAELGRSFGYFEETDHPVWLIYLLAAAGALPLAWRRRFPLLVLMVVYAHFLGVGLTVPMVSALMPLQVVYFIALFTAVAWARDRRAMLVVVSGAILAMLGWLAWQFGVDAGLAAWLDEVGPEQPGLFGPFVAYTVYLWLTNVAYFGGAFAAGQHMWHAARRRQQLAEQAATIERQTVELQQQAVVAERLRIARELHDVVAHHVSVIGIQAAAARRLLARDPDAAAAPLATIEVASRDAVSQMRGLLGTLRDLDRAGPPDVGAGGTSSALGGAGSGDGGGAGEGVRLGAVAGAGAAPGTAPGAAQADPAAPRPRGENRAPEPGLDDIARLADADDGLQVAYRLVEEPERAAKTVPAPVGLSLYRTTQEALANVRRHSTARSATVVVRVDRRPGAAGPGGTERFPHGFAEVEVLDGGRPRSGTSGSGLGMLGIRERVATHGGIAEIGPRVTGGYRVRVRLPLPEDCS